MVSEGADWLTTGWGEVHANRFQFDHRIIGNLDGFIITIGINISIAYVSHLEPFPKLLVI